MAYRRKRRQKYTWLPVIGTELEATGGEPIPLVGRDFSLGASTAPAGIIVPLTADLPRDHSITPDDEGVLSDAIGQEWFLRRLVGKLFVKVASNVSGSDAINAKVTAGFFVARSSDQDPDWPIGGSDTFASSLQPSVFNSYSPAANNALREPWIWRRCWILGNPDIATDTNWPSGIVPSHNLGFASSLDGPHIDAKTLRRISNDDRLFFSISAQTWPLGEAIGNIGIQAHLDLRILGCLRKARNRGVF